MIVTNLLKSSSSIALVVGASFAFMPTNAAAQTWIGGFSNDYADGRNWSGGIAPIAGAVVVIDTNNNAPVVDTGDTVNGGQLNIGPNASGTLTVRSGGTLAATSIGVGGGNNGVAGDGRLLVTGAGSLVTSIDQIFVGIRDSSTGDLTVSDGATVRAGSLQIGGGNGLGEGATGTVTVTGAGSILEITSGLLSMGGNTVNPGQGTLNILAGGRVVGGNGTTNSINPVSTINISGANSSLSGNSNLALNGMLLVEDGGEISYETIIVGGAATLRNGRLSATVVGSSSGLGIGAGGTLTADDSTITVGSNFNVAGSATLRGSTLVAGQIGISQNGVLNVGGADGEAAGAAATLTAQSITVSEPNSRLVFNHTGPDLFVNMPITGNGRVLHRAGTTVMTTPAHQGSIANFDVTGGRLFVNGRVSARNLTVSGGATLGGTGTLNGSVDVTDGIIAPGNRGVGVFTVGNLSLTEASVLNFDLGAPGTPGVGSDLITVGNIDHSGNLTLDGTLNVASAGGFGAGLYRLINYSGTLIDNGLDIGSVPAGFAATDLTVQTAVARQVSLLVGSPISPTFWDGANTAANNIVDGGTGTWTNVNTNWTLPDGTRNGAHDPADLLIFAGTGGTVTVDNSTAPITVASGMQFARNGYTVAGGNIVLDDDSVDQVIFRVGDGTVAGAGFAATIGSALTGGAELQKTDLGTLFLTGANSYRGGTHIVNGAIRGNATSIQGNVRLDDDGTLVFDQTNDGVFAGILSGSGVVRTRGTGVLDITGTSNAFEGMTVVEAGTLRLSGAVGGLTRVGSGGTLTGNGTLAQLDVLGRVAPGGSGIGTLTIDNLRINQEARVQATGSFARDATAAAIATTPDIVFRAGSIYAVDLAASGAGDRINATGTATLEGGTVAITTLDADLAYTEGMIFRILNADGGLTGRFAGLTENSAFLDFALGYDPTGAFLRLSQVRMFPDVARTVNQRAAANALGTLLRPAGSDGLAVYNAVLGLDEDAARAAFDASSGEIYASLLAARQRQGFALTGRFTSRAQADLREGLGVWGGITGHDGRIDADSDINAGRVSSDGIGGEIGIDYRGETNAWAAGFGGGWQDGNVELPVRGSYAKNKTWHVGGYVRVGTSGPGFTAVATAVHAKADTDVTRSINFGTIARSTSANTNVSTTALGVDVRYGWGLGNWSLGPAASLGLSNSRFSSFSESGAGALNLSGVGNRDKLTRNGVGGFVRYGGADGYIDLTAYYVPSDRDDARATLSMAASPQAFTVLAPRGSKSLVRVSASSQYNIAENMSVGGNIGFDRGSDERDLYGHVRLSYRF
jgi:fibronectin-binding autotransporter adhesin